MLSKFIDRPIFATVLSIVGVALAGGDRRVVTLPVRPSIRRSRPPGAACRLVPRRHAPGVADTVAVAIERAGQRRTRHALHVVATGNDGSYSLSVTFDVGTDLNTALVMVQNRVTLAMPLLPSAGAEPGDHHPQEVPEQLDDRQLSLPDGAGTNGPEQLRPHQYQGRVAACRRGVGRRHQGAARLRMRIWLDPQKLASRSMTAIDVANAILDQNIPAAWGRSVNRRRQDSCCSCRSTRWAIGSRAWSSSPHTSARCGPSQAARGGRPRSAACAVPGRGPTRLTDTDCQHGRPRMTPHSRQPPQSRARRAPRRRHHRRQRRTSPTVPPRTSPAPAPPSAPSSSRRAPLGQDAVRAPASVPPSPPSRPRGPACATWRRVELGAPNYNSACTFDGDPSVGLGALATSRHQRARCGRRVVPRMKELKTALPDGVDYTIAYDTTPFIRESIDEFSTLLRRHHPGRPRRPVLLQDWRAMILPMIDVPVSLIGTFAVMAVMGYSLNNISLFGLVLAIGIVVDDAIVVLENIERQMAKGYDTHRHHQGDGGNHRADPGDHAGPLRRVRASAPSSAASRAASSANSR